MLTTLHTNDAPSAITRLIEMGIEPFLVGSSVDCVLAQRLARRLCEWCKQRYTVTAADGSTKDYFVTVTIARNTSKDLTSFAFLDVKNPALEEDVTGVITGRSASMAAARARRRRTTSIRKLRIAPCPASSR